MIEVINRDIGHSDLKEVVNNLKPDSIAKDIEKMCQGTYPLHNVFIRKIEVLKKPRFDLSKLLDLHGNSGKGVFNSSVDGSSWVPKPYDCICSEHFIGDKKSDVGSSPSYAPTIFPSIYKFRKNDTSSAYHEKIKIVHKK
ncbi:hypothetical protein WA026_010295 [Henosepilachna vigintioctopunctata]|uniref:Uncharacterized protein n=1 Tax=Henosepilachna vigintioctopunctata TaxID=420089 RepID=A0AAW1UIQ6_9CUCU